MKTYKMRLSRTYHYGLRFEENATSKMSFTRYFKTIKEAREYIDSIKYNKTKYIARLYDYNEMQYCTEKLH